MIKHSLLLLALTPMVFGLGGCASSPPPKKPAPVVDRTLHAPQTAQRPSARSSVQVQPLPRQQPLQGQEYTLSEGTAPTAPPPARPVPPVATARPQPVAPVTSAPVAPAEPPPARAEPEGPPPTEMSRQGNQAVVALLESAQQFVQKREWDRAAASLERALRLEPKNAGIWHDLAQIRLQQRQYAQAESLAAKSNMLATSNEVRVRNYKLIAFARRAQGNAAGAAEAEAKARGGR